MQTQKVQNQILVEVFKTSLSHYSEAQMLKKLIKCRLPSVKINFDLEDCDNILRIEYNENLNLKEIVRIGESSNIYIEVLE